MRAGIRIGRRAVTLVRMLTGSPPGFSHLDHPFVLLSTLSTLLTAVCSVGLLSELAADAPEVRYSSHTGGMLLLTGALLVYRAVQQECGARSIVVAVAPADESDARLEAAPPLDAASSAASARSSAASSAASLATSATSANV